MTAPQKKLLLKMWSLPRGNRFVPKKGEWIAGRALVHHGMLFKLYPIPEFTTYGEHLARIFTGDSI